MSQTNPVPTPSGVTANATTQEFVGMKFADQETDLQQTWHKAPAEHVRVFHARAVLAASNARHDWALSCALASVLALVGGVLIVRADPTEPEVVGAVVLIVLLAATIGIYRLWVIRITQRSEDRAVSWLTARGLS